MKYKFNNIHQFYAAIALTAIAALATPIAAQIEIDMSTGVPQVMVVESVNLEAGTVTLNGDVYRVSVDKRPTRAALSPNGRALKLSDLEPGMEVLVSTDGTEPGPSYEPNVLGMWDPD